MAASNGANRVTVGGVSFGRFMLALTIAVSAVALVNQLDSRAGWFLVWVILLGMVLSTDAGFAEFVRGISEFVNGTLLGQGGTRPVQQNLN